MIHKYFPAVLVLFAMVGCSGSDDMLAMEEFRTEEQRVLDDMTAFGREPGFPAHFHAAHSMDELIQNMADFFESQAPCSQMTRSGQTLAVDFGDLDDGCEYRGRTYGGMMFVTDLTETDEVLDLMFVGLTDGAVTLDGSASLSIGEDRQTLTAELDTLRDADAFDRPEHGRGHRGGSGREGGEHCVPEGEDGLIAAQVAIDYVYTPYDGSFDLGVQVDGSQQHEDECGLHTGTAVGLRIAGTDRVPEAGTSKMTSPEGHERQMAFERIDDTTIEITMSGERGERSVLVDAATGQPVE